MNVLRLGDFFQKAKDTEDWGGFGEWSRGLSGRGLWGPGGGPSGNGLEQTGVSERFGSPWYSSINLRNPEEGATDFRKREHRVFTGLSDDWENFYGSREAITTHNSHETNKTKKTKENSMTNQTKRITTVTDVTEMTSVTNMASKARHKTKADGFRNRKVGVSSYLVDIRENVDCSGDASDISMQSVTKNSLHSQKDALLKYGNVKRLRSGRFASGHTALCLEADRVLRLPTRHTTNETRNDDRADDFGKGKGRVPTRLFDNRKNANSSGDACETNMTNVSESSLNSLYDAFREYSNVKRLRSGRFAPGHTGVRRQGVQCSGDASDISMQSATKNSLHSQKDALLKYGNVKRLRSGRFASGHTALCLEADRVLRLQTRHTTNETRNDDRADDFGKGKGRVPTRLFDNRKNANSSGDACETNMTNVSESSLNSLYDAFREYSNVKRLRSGRFAPGHTGVRRQGVQRNSIQRVNLQGGGGDPTVNSTNNGGSGEDDFSEESGNDTYENSGIHSCGEMNGLCCFCGAMFFLGETVNGKFTKCCKKGKVVLEPLQSLDPYLQYLFSGSDSVSKRFISNAVSYNNSLSCASRSVNFRQLSTHGPPCLTVNGQIHHFGVPLAADFDSQPKFAQLYFIDPAVSSRLRMEYSHENGMDPYILERLHNYFRENNYIVRSYSMLKEHLETVEREGGVPCENVLMRFVEGGGRERNRLREREQRIRNSPPTVNEIACVFHHFDGTPPYSRDIQIYPRGKFPTKISPYNSLCDTMSYILLFPTGRDLGWSEDRRSAHGISLMNFYSYRLSIRSGSYDMLLRAGNLTGQYMIDAYIKIESARLHYISSHQKELRAETYAGIHDFVNNAAARAGISIGKKIILPSSFIGSNRNMYMRYLNSMKLVSTFGHPDLFITVTCNPRWLEILTNLQYDDQNPYQRWDLISRVFKLKLDALMKDIKDDGIFGDVVAWNYTVEFQKRGMPHCHILVYLKEKIRSPEQVDSIISAEVPGDDAGALREIIVKHSIHGPCGQFNPNASCMVDGKCCKGYPKEFRNSTEMNDSGYPLYKRREGAEFRVGRHMLNNQWVVPYSPYLSLKFNCHINVEVCSSTKAAKYINKYTNKQGYDCCTLSVSSSGTTSLDYDEVACFLNMRYVGAAEAMWRIFSFKMFDISHPILILAVHLPGQNLVHFQEGNEENAIQNCRETTLTAWFKLNESDPSARNLLYPDISSRYSFIKAGGKWIRRKNTLRYQQLSRMSMVSLQDTERFALRLLLLHVPGATGYEDLRRVEIRGEVVEHSNFREAAVARGLISDFREVDLCLQEAIEIQMPHQLRMLFAMILGHCKPSNSVELWTRYKTHFVEDYISDQVPPLVAERIALTAINNELANLSSTLSLANFGFSLDAYENPIDEEAEDLSPEETDLVDHEISTLNAEQRIVFESIIRSASGEIGGGSNLFYLDGPGGTGKTYLYNVIIKQLIRSGISVIPLAMTGLAATLLKNGRTVHRAFALPISDLIISSTTLSPNSKEGREMTSARVIIIDEATLMSANILKWIDLTLRDLMKSSTSFGGEDSPTWGGFPAVSSDCSASQTREDSGVLHKGF